MLDKIRDFFKRDEVFSEKLKDSKNPFLGTLSLIWVIRNWQIVYAVFFDDREFLIRLEFIKGRISATTFPEILVQFGINILLTFLAIVVIYSLVYFTRYITNKFENQLLPWIYSKSAKGKIVLREELEELEEKKEQLEERLKKEKDRRIEAEGEVQSLEEELRKNSLRETTSRIKSIQEDIEDSEGDDLTQATVIKEEEIFHSILSNNEEEALRAIFDKVLNGFEFSPDAYNKSEFRELVRKNLLLFRSKETKGGVMRRHYDLTDRGRRFINEYL